MYSVPFSEADYLLASYHYTLPQDQIAQYPVKRGKSRLLVVDRKKGDLIHTNFSRLADFLPIGALLVVNNSQVIPARLFGRRVSRGGKSEFLLLTPLPVVEHIAHKDANDWRQALVEGLIKPSKKVRPGDIIEFGKSLYIDVLEKGEFGQHRVCLHWHGSLCTLLKDNGHLPLPPYIRRTDSIEDKQFYQTVYARNDKAGSVAAPTAGLHFTSEMRKSLIEKGFKWAEVTLHVGYGTFSPVRSADIRKHVMHSEFVEISDQTAQTIADAKQEGRPIVAVGTTSTRTLEGVAGIHGGIVTAYTGWINCFIHPGYTFQVIDGLITNFHLPESTLLMLVSALTGREKMLSIYTEAVQRGYRFFSYGDAMFIF